MDHTHIVTAADLEQFADRRESQAVIPELVYWLVRLSCPKISICRIPYGDAVNQPGNDGLVEVENAFYEFVPEGKSYWEIGTGGNPQSKATADFRKRNKSLASSDKSIASFMFVTPRSSGIDGWNEPAQARWAKAREGEGWKALRILDGVKLADWLREYPAVGRWMLKKIGLSTRSHSITTPAEHWENIQSHAQPGDPQLPPKVFTIGRENACAALHKLFTGESQRLLLFAESSQDVDDFVAAYLASLNADVQQSMASRCLFINDVDTWHSVVSVRVAHVLVAHPRLALESEGANLQTSATRQGHAVVIPICGAWSGSNHEIIKLRSPSQSLLESTFSEAGYSALRARELAGIGADRLSALIRHFLGLSGLPPYATWENARLFAQAGLFGKWDGKNPSDLNALEMVLGKSYGEWMEIVRNDALRSDAPLTQRDEQWRMVARGEAWTALGARLSDEDLDRFLKMAVLVLGERDPQFDLEADERYAAAIHGKQLSHSSRLREGVAETLALMGSRPGALSSCSEGKGDTVATLVVRELLEKADWCRWAGLDGLLPLLAEAAPDEFLDSVESALLDLGKSPFHQVFGQESSSGIQGWNYMSGLLWALETLAWHPDYLSRVTLILGDLAAIDPGGNWANRPSNSLADIFLPWHLQTCANLERRKSAIEALLRDQCNVGWQLLLALLPHNHGSTSGCRRPAWRDLISPDWKSTITNGEYWDQISVYTELALRIAKADITKLSALLDSFSDLPEDAQTKILDHLKSNSIVNLSEQERYEIWDSLDKLVKKHLRFAEADWAMSEETANKIGAVSIGLAPQSPALRFKRLFSVNDFELYEKTGDYDSQRKQFDERRERAIRELLDEKGLNGVQNFAHSVGDPYQVGIALSSISSATVETELLPCLLEDADIVHKKLVDGFVSGRFSKLGWPWADSCLAKNWSASQICQLLLLLPFGDETWKRIEQFLPNSEDLYWRRVWIGSWIPTTKLTTAAEKLILYSRPNAATRCLAQVIENADFCDVDLVTKTLLAVLQSNEPTNELDPHSIAQLIGWLQNNPACDADAIFKIEWNFLPLLDRHSGRSPKTLERRLAADPAFYCEVIALIFRSKDKPKEIEEPTEQQRNLARNAYKLLRTWKIPPGSKADGTFDPDAFTNWLDEAKKIATGTGHVEIALSQVGEVLPYVPSDADGLWIHHAVARALDAKDAKRMRSGFTMKLFNQRGVHGFSAGKAERELARENRERANALDAKGYSRFATAMREFAEQYERYAKREESRDPFEED